MAKMAFQNIDVSDDHRYQSEKLLEAEEKKLANCEKKVNESPGDRFKPHRKFPSLSSAIDIQTTVEKGRFCVASRDIALGEIILIEEPAVSRSKLQLFVKT